MQCYWAERVTGGMKEGMKDERQDEHKGVTGTLVILRLLRGLHGLSDLHADNVNLCLAVLKHLLSCLKKLLVLQRGYKKQELKRNSVLSM